MSKESATPSKISQRSETSKNDYLVITYMRIFSPSGKESTYPSAYGLDDSSQPPAKPLGE